jgi:hypothetical protein
MDGTTLRWNIVKDEAGGGATLRFLHSGWRKVTDFCASRNAMWGNLMFRLKDSVEGNGRGPQWRLDRLTETGLPGWGRRIRTGKCHFQECPLK